MTGTNINRTLELIPLAAAGGMIWNDPSVIAALILGLSSIIVALIHKYKK